MMGYPLRDDWSGWNHTGRSHEPLARLFWNAFFACFEESATLQFADEPDFSGTIFSPEEQREIHFYGDIGQVSVSTFLLDVLPHLEKGDLWISIPDDRMQILLKPLVNFRDLVGRAIEAVLGISSRDQPKRLSEDELPTQNKESVRPDIIQMPLWR